MNVFRNSNYIDFNANYSLKKRPIDHFVGVFSAGFHSLIQIKSLLYTVLKYGVCNINCSLICKRQIMFSYFLVNVVTQANHNAKEFSQQFITPHCFV